MKGGTIRHLDARSRNDALARPNPDGRRNADVIRPWVNGLDIGGRPRGMSIIDFDDRPIAEAALYEAPFEYVRAAVKPQRDVKP